MILHTVIYSIFRTFTVLILLFLFSGFLSVSKGAECRLSIVGRQPFLPNACLRQREYHLSIVSDSSNAVLALNAAAPTQY
jgi:hypothetical protein